MVPIGDDGLPFLSGTVPGLLDPSQSSRLLRTATCTLFFATFDPSTADTSPFLSGRKETQLHPDASTGGLPPGECFSNAVGSASSRIVIEVDSQRGTCTWRFVPPAMTRSRLGNEGPWPKVVILCGQIVRMTQDQWEIYKLDPHYDCITRDFPYITTITRAPHAISTISPVSGLTSEREPRGLSPTRQMSLDGDSFKVGLEGPAKDQLPPGVNDERRKLPTMDTMPIDGPPPVIFNTASLHEPVKGRMNLGTRKEPSMDAMSIDGESFYLGAIAPSQEKVNARKRTRSFEYGHAMRQSRVHSDVRDSQEPPKRARTRSPGAIRREMGRKRAAREAVRRQRLAARINARNAALHESFWKDVGADGSSDLGEETEVDDSGTERGYGEEEDEDEEEEEDHWEEDYTARFEDSRTLVDESAHGPRRKEACEEYRQEQGVSQEEPSAESDVR